MRCFLVAFVLLLSQTASAIHVSSKQVGLNFTTSKIATVYGDITDAMVDTYEQQVAKTSGIPGPRVVLIDSPGGYVDAGNAIIAMLEAERALGVKQVCVVLGGASSMAFNLLSHCDVRLAVADAHMVVHKVEGWGPGMRHTAANLRRVADDLDRTDEPFRQLNSRMMHLTLRQYDRYADAETNWSPQELLNLRYLDGIIKLDRPN